MVDFGIGGIAWHHMSYHDSLSLERERDQVNIGNTSVYSKRHHSNPNHNVISDTNNINKGEKSIAWHGMAFA